MKGGKSEAEKDVAKRTRLLTWQKVADSAPAESVLRTQADAIVARLKVELGE